VWRGDFSLVHGNDHRQDTDGPTGNESTGNEHTDVDSGSLKGTSDNSNDGTDLNGPLSTVSVGSPTSHDGTEKGTCGEEGDNGSNDTGGRGVEVVVEVYIRSRDDGTNDTGIVAEEERSKCTENVSFAPVPMGYSSREDSCNVVDQSRFGLTNAIAARV